VRRREEKMERSKRKQVIDEEIEDDRSTRKTDCGQLNKRKNPPLDALEHCEKEGKTGWRSLENMGQVDLGF
jgi:hypothetical protein